VRTQPYSGSTMRAFPLAAAAAVACTLVALVLDLREWAGAAGPGIGATSPWWRFVRTVVAVAPVVTFVAIPARGPRLLAASLLLTIIADWFLVMRADLMTGIGVFAVVQVLLIWRHLHGVALRRYLAPPLLGAVSLGAAVVVVGNAALWSALSPRGLAWPVFAYSVLLLTAVVTAYGTRETGTLSVRASRCAFWGMVLFVLCDITVGIGAAFGHTSAGAFTRALTGLFYTPALLLLVRSGEPVRPVSPSTHQSASAGR
jgi:YhhN family